MTDEGWRRLTLTELTVSITVGYVYIYTGIYKELELWFIVTYIYIYLVIYKRGKES